MTVLKVEGVSLFANAAFSLVTKRVPENRRGIYAHVVAENFPQGIYVSQAEEQEILKLTAALPTTKSYDLIVPWSRSNTFQPSVTMTSIVQFHDELSKPLPGYLFPIKQIEEYSNRILNSATNPTLNQQYEIALKIAENNPIAATYLLAIASRVNCRGLDHNKDDSFRNADQILEWYKKINIFDFLAENDTQKKRIDWAGNLYYFWTHVFGKLYLSHLHDTGFPFAKQLDELVLGQGTRYMKIARNLLAGQPQMSNYEKASAYGRNTGQAIYNYFKTISN